jgi:hypothetical protein
MLESVNYSARSYPSFYKSWLTPYRLYYGGITVPLDLPCRIIICNKNSDCNYYMYYYFIIIIIIIIYSLVYTPTPSYDFMA